MTRWNYAVLSERLCFACDAITLRISIRSLPPPCPHRLCDAACRLFGFLEAVVHTDRPTAIQVRVPLCQVCSSAFELCDGPWVHACADSDRAFRAACRP
jgi:hypothetical protein